MKTQRLLLLMILFTVSYSSTALDRATPTNLNDYTGKYLHDNGATVLITAEEGELYAVVMGRPKIKINPSEAPEDVYVNETIGSTGVIFTFERISGEVKSLTFEVDGARFTCQKTE